MSRFNNSGIGLVSSITQMLLLLPCNIVSATDNQAGFSLTGSASNEATTEVDVTPVAGMELVLVNNGGTKYRSAITIALLILRLPTNRLTKPLPKVH